ncbi:hypothetical protein JCM3770_004801 [Rhodotorula araucariae]
MGIKNLHAYLTQASREDVLARDQEARKHNTTRDKRLDFVVYVRTLSDAVETIRQDGRKRMLHVVDGGICYNDAREAASGRDVRSKNRIEAQEQIGAAVQKEQLRLAAELLDSGEAVDRVVVINDHPSQRPVVKDATNVARAMKGGRKYSGKLRLRNQDMIANGQDNWWVFNELEYAAPAFQSADGKTEIRIAEHEAEPAMYNVIKQHERTDDTCIVIHAVDSDLIPLAVASGAEYIVQPLRHGYNIYRMSAVGEAPMEAVWPFRHEAANALAAMLIGNDYTRGLMGVGPKKLVTATSLTDFARRDWALLDEAEPDDDRVAEFAAALQTAVADASLSKPAQEVQPARLAALTLENVREIARVMMGRPGTALQSKADALAKARQKLAEKAQGRAQKSVGNIYFRSDEPSRTKASNATTKAGEAADIPVAEKERDEGADEGAVPADDTGAARDDGEGAARDDGDTAMRTGEGDGEGAVRADEGADEGAVPAADEGTHKKGSHGAGEPYRVGFRAYPKADPLVELRAAARQALQHSQEELAPTGKRKAAQPAPQAVPEHVARKQAREGKLKEMTEDDDDDFHEGGSRKGIKHICRKMPIRVASGMAYRDVVGTDVDSNADEQPRDAMRAALDAASSCLGAFSVVATAVLPELRAAAASIYPLHSLNQQLLDGADGLRIVMRNIHLIWMRKAGLKRRAGKVGERKDGLEDEKKDAHERHAARIETLCRLHFGGAREDDSIDTLEVQFEQLDEELLGWLADRKIPLFFYSSVEAAYERLDLCLPNTPVGLFEANFKQVGTGHRTAAKKAIPTQVRHLAEHLALDPVGMAASFVSEIGQKLGAEEEAEEAGGAGVAAASVGEPALSPSAEPDDNTAAAKDAKSNEDAEALLAQISSGDPAWISVRDATAFCIETALYDCPLTGDAGAWMSGLGQQLFEMLRWKTSRRKLGASEAGCRRASVIVAAAIDRVRAVLARAFALALPLKCSPGEVPTLHAWIADAEYAGGITALAAFQDSWIVWMGKTRGFGMHTRTVVLNSLNLYTVIDSADKLIDAAVQNLNRLIDGANDALAGTRSPSAEPATCHAWHGLSFTTAATSKDAALQVAPVKVKERVKERVQSLKAMLCNIVPTKDFDDWIHRFHEASAMVMHVLFKLPDVERLLPPAYVTVSPAQVTFLMLDPAYLKGAESNRIGQRVGIHTNQLVNATSSNNSDAYGNGRGWSRGPALRAFAKTPVYERRGNETTPEGTKRDEVPKLAQRIEPLFTIVAEAKGVVKPLTWAHGQSGLDRERRVQSIKWSGERSVVVDKLTQRHSRDEVLRKIAEVGSPAVAYDVSASKGGGPSKPRNKKSKTGSGKNKEANAEANKPRDPAEPLKTLAVDALDKDALVIGADPGQHHSFVLSILPPLTHGAEDGNSDHGSTTIRFGGHQLVAQEKANQRVRIMQEQGALPRQILQAVKQLDTSDMHNDEKEKRATLVTLLERAWEDDVPRRMLLLRQELAHEARLKGAAADVRTAVVKEAVERGATAEKPVKVIVANGTGTKNSRRSKHASGSDQRQEPLRFEYTALQAARELDVVFVDTNEDFTSQSCPRPSCRAQRAGAHEVIQLEQSRYIETDTPCYRVLRCTHCGTVFERDYVGASNIGQAALFHLWTGLHLFSREVEQALGLGLRDSHKTEEEKRQPSTTPRKPIPLPSTTADGAGAARDKGKSKQVEPAMLAMDDTVEAAQ